MDAVRYFRGLGPARRGRGHRLVVAVFLIALAAVTVLAAIQELS